MGDRELPVANRTVQKRWLRYTAAVHAENKSTTKTSIPLEPPPTYNFLSSRSKRNQVFLERNATIERENLILLDKMRHIMTERQMDPAEPFSKDSLNRGARKQEMIRIMAANESLLRRIQCRKPSYQVSEFEKEHAKKEYLLSRVGKFPYVSESVPDMTPPPIPSNKLVYYGPASRAAVYMAKQKRHQPNSPGLLPKLSGTQSARNAASTSSNQNSTTNLNGTTTSPAQPATSRPAAGGRGKQQKIQVFAETIDVEGVAVNLTVFEKPESSKCSAGLEFIGVTEDDSSTALPAFYAYTTLSEAFGARKKKPAAEEEEEGQQDKPDEESKDESKDTESARTIPQSYFNNPLQTRSLVRELISKLTWVDSGKEDGKRNLILAGVEQELRKPPPPKGALLYTRISVNARGLPKDKVQTNAPVAVLYAMNEETQQYQQIAHTPLVKPVTSTKATPTSSTASLPPTQEYAGNVIIPHYELIDGPLRMGIFEVDAQNNVIPTSCLGECKWMIQAMMSAKTGLKLKLLKNGRPIPHLRGEPEGLVFINSEPSSAEEAKKQSEAPPATAATKTKKTPKKKKEVEETKEAEASPSKDEESKEEEDEKAATSKKAEDEEESEAKTGSKDEEEDAADDEDDLSSSKKVKKLFQGGRNLQGVELLIRIVDGDDVPAKQRPKEVHEEHAILYQLYYRPSSLVFDHAIAKSALPDLLSQLVTPCDSDLLQDQVEALLELFTASKDGEDIKVLFQSKDLVSWKDLPASSSTEAKPKAVEDKAEPKASPAKAKPAPVNTEAASSPKTSPKTSPKSSPRAGLKKQASVEKPAKTEKKPLVDEKASVASKVDAFEKEAEKEQKEAAAEETKSDKEKKKAAASAEEDEEAKPSVQSTPAKKKSTDKVDSTPKVDKKKSVDAKIADKEKEKEQLTRTPSKKEIKKSPSTTKVGADKEKEKDKKKPVSAEKKEKGKEAEKPKAEEADKKPEPAEAKPSGKTSGDISETEQPKDGLDDLPDIGKDLDDESLPAIAKSDEKASTSRPKTAEKSAPASRPKTAEKTTPAPAAAAAAAKEEEKNPAEAKPKSAEKRKTAEKPVGAAAASSEKRKTADKDTLPSDKEKTLLQKKSSVDGTREAKDEATLQTSPELTEELDADFADLIDVDEADKKQEEAEEKKKMDEEAAKKKKKADEEAAAKKKADEEAAAAKKKADEEAAAAKKKADEEAASASADADKKKGEEEEAAKKAAAEAKAKSDADDAAAVAEKAKAAEEEAAKKKEAHEKAAKEKADAEAKAKADKEAKEKAEKEAAEAKAKSDKEAADKKAAEEKAAKEKADREAAAKKAAEDKKKAEEAAAAAEAEKKKKAEDEAAAAAAKKKADDEAAAAATKKAEADKKAAEEAAKEEKRKKKAAEKEAARAKLEADAKEALAKGPTPVTFTMNITCKHLPIPAAHPDGLSPMVAMYAEAPDGQYGFVSQTERVDKNQSPSFSTQIVYETDQNTPAAALMFSIYHVVEGVALSEDDMVGQALSTQGDLMLALAGKKTLELPIQANGELVAKAHVTLTNLAMVPGHASKAAASGEDSSPKIPYEIYVSCKNLKRGADGNAVVSSMCALYQADENNEFAFLAQTERIEDNTNPIFETPIRLEASLVVDRHLMFSLYHVNEGAEISAEDQIGAATTTVHALIAATEAKPLKLQIVKDETTLEGAEIEAYAKKL